jgi:hypothetical protein
MTRKHTKLDVDEASGQRLAWPPMPRCKMGQAIPPGDALPINS